MGLCDTCGGNIPTGCDACGRCKPPRISPELAAKIAAEIVDYMRPAETPYIANLLIPNVAEIIERVGNAN